MNIVRRHFGTTADGQSVEQYVLASAVNVTVKVMTYGARITEVHVPDRHGVLADVVLGFGSLDPYLAANPYFGATLGRYANRIGGGKFSLDGRLYRLSTNEGGNTLHGGVRGFDKVVWTAAEPFESAGACGVAFTFQSPHMQDGFPGDLFVTVLYTLNDNGELKVGYVATTDRNTPVNLSNHSYFNLAGAGCGDALGHVLTLRADAYTPVDEQKIPTGEIRSVRHTPLDFITPMCVGTRLSELDDGYDFNFVLSPPVDDGPAVEVIEPISGRKLEIRTTQPGMQFYSGNQLDGSQHGIGGAYGKHAAVVFEPQHFPDSVHHPNFPTTILCPGETYRQTNRYRFGVTAEA